MSALLEAVLYLFGDIVAWYAADRQWTRGFLFRLALLLGAVIVIVGGVLWLYRGGQP